MTDHPSHSQVSRRSSNVIKFGDGLALEPVEMREDDHIGSNQLYDNHDVVSATGPSRRSSVQQTVFSQIGRIRRSSNSQRSLGRDSLASRMDSRASHISRRRSVTEMSDHSYPTSTPHRSERTTSTSGFPRPQSPCQGPTGPSQPYGMYAQGATVTRTPSAATTSTVRLPERSYSGPSEPTQPYGMYHQGTVPEDNPFQDSAHPVAGFPGLAGQNYRRRLGVDEEDADDLIGPDGYTEQLPPYTRYPDGIPPKHDTRPASLSAPPPMSGPQTTNTQSESRLSTANDGREDIPVRPHPVLSQERSEGATPTNPFSDSNNQLSPSQASTSTAAGTISKIEINHDTKGFAAKAKKRVCCGVLPCWLLAVIIVAILLAVLVGGIIGGALAHQHAVERENQRHMVQTTIIAPIQPTATVTADAIPVSSTPSNLPPLPTGLFDLTLNHPSTVTGACLTGTQSKAWDCATGADLSLNISSLGSNGPVISVSYPQPPKTVIRYGAQPPQLDDTAPLKLVFDKSDFNKGPAYYFTHDYNKTIVVRESDMPKVSSKSKRSLGGLSKRWLAHDTRFRDTLLHERDEESKWSEDETASPTDRPWYCFWNGTTLEGYIYVQTAADTSSNAATAASAVPSPSQSSGSASYVKRRTVPSTSAYPKLVKVEERRSKRGSVLPYCQQMQILDDFRVNPVRDLTTQKLVQIMLTENESWSQKQNMQAGPPYPGHASEPPGTADSESSYKTRLRNRQAAGAASDCMCEWETT